MVPNEVRRSRRGGSPRPGVEGLEVRELLSYSPLGFSLPDLTVTGVAAPVAAYQQTLTVSVDVRNLGASSTVEPLLLEPGAPSSADAPPSVVTVFLSRSPHAGRAPLVPVGTIAVPTVPQNSLVTVTQTLTMPPRLRSLPANGGTLYAYFRIDQNQTIIEHDRRNNFTRTGVPVQVAVGLPDLYAVALDVPPVMQPGDVIAPLIRVGNFGTTNPSQQSAFEVDLVASTDTNFGPGDSVLQRFLVTNVPPLSSVPMRNAVLGDVNINVPGNFITLQSETPVKLPSTPGQYYIGVVVDPQNVIREISEVGRGPDPRLEPIRVVGPPSAYLPPAGVLSDPAPPGNVFPYPAFGPLVTPGVTNVPTTNTTTTTTTTTATTPTSTTASTALRLSAPLAARLNRRSQAQAFAARSLR